MTPTQERVARELLQAVASTQEDSRVVILEGFSGIGKSLLVNAIRERLETADAVIVEDYYRLDGLSTEIKNSLRPIIVLSTVYEAGVLRQNASQTVPGRQLMSLILPAMNSEEIAEYLSGRDLSRSQLDADRIAVLCLGIPLLADYIVGSGANEDEAILLAATYLQDNLHGEEGVATYLQVSVPSEVTESAEGVGSSWRATYESSLMPIMRKMREAEEDGSHHESPFFVARESGAIYGDMFQQCQDCMIRLYVPEITSEQLTQLLQVLGYCQGYICSMPERRTRSRLFGATYRKTAFIGRYPNGRDVTFHSEGPEPQDLLERFKRRHAKGEFQLDRFTVDVGQFLLSVFDHSGMPLNPTMLGWAVESWLQHRGILYVAENMLYGNIYTYDPKDRQIHTITKIDRLS